MSGDKSHGFLVIEYVPKSMTHDKPAQARMDGHWFVRSLANEVAEYFAEEPIFGGKSRVVVAEIIAEMKKPESWDK
jgi:hypothetical protein